MRSAWRALGAYLVITLIVTWPLLPGLARDVAWDLGDPVLVMWAIAWDCEQLLRILRGDLSHLTAFFDANIFYPVPLTLAYSEHFIPQAVQILPVYAATSNPILCYNLLFLSTFVLSGLGTYLFVRELTGNANAAFVAGLLFAFAPYRLPQAPHLQVLSSQWMPFALYGFRRYFDTGRWRPLAGAAAALIVQNLSCGYYLLYFSPFAAGYVLWEIAVRRMWRDRTLWLRLGAAAGLVALATIPMLLPYLAVRSTLQFARARAEVMQNSADVYSYWTAAGNQPLWGSIIQAFPKNEGTLFPGFVAVLLASIGIAAGLRRHSEAAPAATTTRRWLPALLATAAALHLVAAAAVLLYRRLVLDLGLFTVRMTNVDQLLVRAAVLVIVLLAISPPARARAAAFAKQGGFFLVAALVAAWLTLGPAPHSLGRPLSLTGLYQPLLEYVPGFDGVRVPARFAMIGALMLAVLGGYGAAVIAAWRRGQLLLVAIGVACLAEGIISPFVVNGTAPLRDFNAPEARLHTPRHAPAVYGAVARQPSDAVLAELPLGVPDFDVRAMFYSIGHWRHLLNGYSGFFPPHYGALTVALSNVPGHPDVAWDSLRRFGTTLVLVHESAYLGDEGARTSAALRRRGAVELFRDGGDTLLQLPR